MPMLGQATRLLRPEMCLLWSATHQGVLRGLEFLCGELVVVHAVRVETRAVCTEHLSVPHSTSFNPIEVNTGPTHQVAGTPTGVST